MRTSGPYWLMKPNIHAYNLVDAMPDYSLSCATRAPGVSHLLRRTPQRLVCEDQHQGAAAGPLHGKRIAVKDNVMVAGVPMMNGCSILEGYMPEIDAGRPAHPRCWRRDRGQGPLRIILHFQAAMQAPRVQYRNPYKMGYAAGGGSSAGGGVVVGEATRRSVVTREDRFASPRAGGIYGMKPTPRLVPYTGHHADRNLRRSHRAYDADSHG